MKKALALRRIEEGFMEFGLPSMHMHVLLSDARARRNGSRLGMWADLRYVWRRAASHPLAFGHWRGWTGPHLLADIRQHVPQ